MHEEVIEVPLLQLLSDPSFHFYPRVALSAMSYKNQHFGKPIRERERELGAED